MAHKIYTHLQNKERSDNQQPFTPYKKDLATMISATSADKSEQEASQPL